MGNTQSAEAPRRPPTKLTKPRTNTSTSNLLATASTTSRRSSNLDLPVAPNKHSSTITIDDVTDDDEAAVSKAADLPKRRSLFRSKSAVIESPAQKVKPETEIQANSASNPLQRYSSVGSMRPENQEEPQYGHYNIRPPMRASRSANNNHHSDHMQHLARLSLVVEVQTPEPEARDGSKQLGLQRGYSDEDIQEERIPIERSNSDQSLSIPIRRRSLLTPGIATRSTSNEDTSQKSNLPLPNPFEYAKSGKESRRSLPAHMSTPQEQLRQFYYDQSKPMSSPLEDLAALRVQQITNQEARAVTPCGLEYGYTGAFKLGSLRITNGAASPAPSGHKREYWDNESPVDGSCPARSHTPPKNEELPLGRPYTEWSHTSIEVMGPENTFNVTDQPPRIVETMVEIPGSSLGWSAFQSVETVVQDFETTPPTTASGIAQAYMQEIASSPFSFEETPPPSPKFQATSKTTAIEDCLFDDDSGSLISLAPPSPLERALKKSSQPANTQPGNAELFLPIKNAGNSEANTPKRIQGPREQAPKPLEKADSGYSSKTSLRSFGSGASNLEKEAPRQDQPAPAVPSKSPPRPPPKTLYSRDSCGANIKSSMIQGFQIVEIEDAPLTPAKDIPSALSNESIGFLSNSRNPVIEKIPRRELSRSSYPEASSAPKQQSFPSVARRSGPPPLPIKSIEQTQAAARMSVENAELPDPPVPRRQSMPNSVSAISVRPALKQSESELSIATKRKLQKQRQRPAPQASVIVQGYTEIETANIPPVSQDAADHLEERLKNFPTLAHTYKSVHRTNSKETLSTIFSMAPTEQRTEGAVIFTRFGGLPIAPSNEDIEQSVIKQSVLMHVAQLKSSPVKSKFWRRSLDGMRGRRKSMENDNSDDESAGGLPIHQLTIKDFGTISNSLGASPYEIANTACASEDSQCSTIPNGHAGGRPPRGRLIGMNSYSAAQFARDRSRILRRQSFDVHVNNLSLADVAVATTPHDVAEDAPPLPTVPREIRSERPGLKRMKSPPPVSMTAPWAAWAASASAPPKPKRAAPVLPPTTIEVSSSQSDKSGEQQYDSWQKQESLWRGKKESANNVFQTRSMARRSLDSTSTSNPKPSLAQQYRQHPQILTPGPPGQQSQAHTTRGLSSERQQPRSQPPNARPSFEQQSSAPSVLQTRNHALARQAFDSLQPRLEKRAMARASFDSTTSPNGRSTHPLSHSMSHSDIPSLPPLTIDRYNGGFGYSYEPGYGIGGSAGTRNGTTAASRKGVEGSLLWGVDFSDVPIIVRQTPKGLEVEG